MKKIIIIGCPGSGKSTFAREVHKVTQLPLYHLDNIFWNPDKSSINKEEFIAKQEDILKEDRWIIDGNYYSTLERRLYACDKVFLLDYSLDICLDGIESRKGKSRLDFPWVEYGEDREFLNYVKNFNTEVRPHIDELLKKYESRSLTIFKSREEAGNFITRLKNCKESIL